MSTIDFGSLNFEEALALLNGETLESARESLRQRKEIWKLAEQYIDLPPEQWPSLTFNWDLSPESQRFSLDGVKAEEFKEQYPSGFRLGWVLLQDFDKKLCHYSRRDGIEELWGLGSKTQLASVIAYVSKGLPITPPLIKRSSANEVIIAGGHHRYAAAKAVGLEKIPIYVAPRNVRSVSKIVTVSWV